jgi:hypothetical protein
MSGFKISGIAVKLKKAKAKPFGARLLKAVNCFAPNSFAFQYISYV